MNYRCSMKPTELRLGNWIGFTISDESDNILILGQRGIVREISKSIVLLEEIEIAIPVNGLYPIPLTEEILLSAGFHKSYAHRNPQFVLPINWPFVHEVRTELLCLELVEGKFTSEHCFNRVILYVHQLQNLIFALTGQELEIKL